MNGYNRFVLILVANRLIEGLEYRIVGISIHLSQLNPFIFYEKLINRRYFAPNFIILSVHICRIMKKIL